MKGSWFVAGSGVFSMTTLVPLLIAASGGFLWATWSKKLLLAHGRILVLELAILLCMDVASGFHMSRMHNFHPPESFLSNFLVSDVEERNQTIKHWKYTILTFFRLSLGGWYPDGKR